MVHVLLVFLFSSQNYQPDIETVKFLHMERSTEGFSVGVGFNSWRLNFLHLGSSWFLASFLFTLPETNVAPENQWLED